MIQTGDNIKRISSILSGSLNLYFYLGLEDKDKQFSDLVYECRNNEWFEPNPKHDLLGIDYARKLLILARTLGAEINLQDLEVTELIPPDIASIEKDENFAKNR
eukprot:UN00234